MKPGAHFLLSKLNVLIRGDVVYHNFIISKEVYSYSVLFIFSASTDIQMHTHAHAHAAILYLVKSYDCISLVSPDLVMSEPS